MCFSVEIERDIKKLATRFNAHISTSEFKELHHKKQGNPSQIKVPAENNIVYPNYYAPVILMDEKSHRIIRPFRYRVRPAGSGQEIPSKYNLFNARLDMLEKRNTWRSLFMRNHCLFPFKKFYEWVENKEGKKVLVNFYPEDRDLMWAPGLYDIWVSPSSEEKIFSFALITTDPPEEVSEMGHDRCPLFLKEEKIDEWLTPRDRSKSEIYSLLEQKEQTHYGCLPHS